MLSNIISFLSYKSVWIFGVYGSLYNLDFISPIIATIYVIWTLKQYHFKPLFFAYLFLISISGILIESFIFNHFVYDLNLQNPLRPIVPVWLIALWFSFPCMCATSLVRPLKNLYFVFIFGFFACPLPYLGASSLGTITITNEFKGFLMLGFIWVLIMLSIHFFIKKLHPN